MNNLKFINSSLDSLGYKGRYSFKLGEFPKEYHPGSTAIITLSGQDIGYIGKVHPNETKKDIFVAEINIDAIRQMKASPNKFKELTKYFDFKTEVPVDKLPGYATEYVDGREKIILAYKNTYVVSICKYVIPM